MYFCLTYDIEMGFDGKQAIHPNQIETIYKLFTPPPASIDFARKIVEESRKHFSSGVGAWEIEGKMIDAPMIKVR
jgi:citrate lyase beta subunit